MTLLALIKVIAFNCGSYGILCQSYANVEAIIQSNMFEESLIHIICVAVLVISALEAACYSVHFGFKIDVSSFIFIFSWFLLFLCSFISFFLELAGNFGFFSYHRCIWSTLFHCSTCAPDHPIYWRSCNTRFYIHHPIHHNFCFVLILKFKTSVVVDWCCWLLLINKN